MKLLYLFAFIIISSALQAHVDLEYPNGGEIFQAGDTLTITWQEGQAHNTIGWNLYFSQDGGDTWETIQIGLPSVRRSLDWIIPEISTSEAKIMVVQDNEVEDYNDESGRFTIESSTTSIGFIQPESESFILVKTPYPNPGYDIVNVQCNVKKGIEANIQIINSSGEVVKILNTGFLKPGSYDFKWLSEKEVPGLYFVIVYSEYFKISRKVLLVR